MKLLDQLKDKLGMGTHCPKHKIEYYYHGWDDLRACDMCDEEYDLKIKEQEKKEWEMFLSKHPEFKRK